MTDFKRAPPPDVLLKSDEVVGFVTSNGTNQTNLARFNGAGTALVNPAGTAVSYATLAGAEVLTNKTYDGTILPTGGIAAAGGFITSARLCHTGGEPAIATTSGTNLNDTVATVMYLAEVFVPANVSVTGVAIFNGTAVAGNGKVALFSVAANGTSGTRVAVSGSTAMSGTTAYQLIPFTGAPIAVLGPATYFIGAIYDTTTHDMRHHALGSFATGKITGLTYATDAGFATGTMPTTFATAEGPIASLY